MTKNWFKCVWTFTIVKIVGASQLLQRSSSVLSQGFWLSRDHAANWKKSELSFRLKSEKGFQSCNLFHLYASFSVNFTWCYCIWSFSRVKSKEGDSFSLVFVTRCFLFWKVCTKTTKLRFSNSNSSIIRWQPYVTSDAQFSLKYIKTLFLFVQTHL